MTNEYSHLGDTLETISERQKVYQREVYGHIAQLADAIAKLSNKLDSLEASINNIESASNGIAHGVDNLTSSVQEISYG